MIEQKTTVDTQQPPMMYKIEMPIDEQDIIKGILSNRTDEISISICNRIAMKITTWAISSFENGFLMGVLSSQRDIIPETWKQLIDIINQIRKDGGVEITDVVNNMVELKDVHGFAIIRQKYDWE
jgi:hypothetical protein